MEALTLGERLALLRRRQQLTQVQLATLCGTTQTEIYRLETGVIQDPHISLVIKLARTFEVSTDWLLGLHEVAHEGNNLPRPTPPRKRPRPRKATPVG
jgi:transcriptional regulator with XRE-family HTH domain